MPTKKVIRTVEFPPEIYAELQLQARENGISPSAQIRLLIVQEERRLRYNATKQDNNVLTS